MRKIITTTFLTLDGIMQAPGGPQEDTTGGFSSGGWTANYGDGETGEVLTGFMNMPFELLLGRKTYDIFASYWPNAKTDLTVANPFNATRKYFVSHHHLEPRWKNSACITGDVVSEIKKLKESEAPDLWVWGSGNLIQTLLKNHLIDRMHIWTYPVTTGTGKRLFAEGTQPEGFKLVEVKSSSSGVIIGTYESTGQLKTGTVGQD
jgi:dihydrofolate reductase